MLFITSCTFYLAFFLVIHLCSCCSLSLGRCSPIWRATNCFWHNWGLHLHMNQNLQQLLIKFQ